MKVTWTQQTEKELWSESSQGNFPTLGRALRSEEIQDRPSPLQAFQKQFQAQRKPRGLACPTRTKGVSTCEQLLCMTVNNFVLKFDQIGDLGRSGIVLNHRPVNLGVILTFALFFFSKSFQVMKKISSLHFYRSFKKYVQKSFKIAVCHLNTCFSFSSPQQWAVPSHAFSAIKNQQSLARKMSSLTSAHEMLCYGALEMCLQL